MLLNNLTGPLRELLVIFEIVARKFHFAAFNVALRGDAHLTARRAWSAVMRSNTLITS